MRDVLIFAAVFGSLPFILRRPYLGILVWSVLAYLNPHRLSWGAAFDFRFSLVVGAVLLVAVVFSRERKRMIWTPLTVTWLLFFAWTALTTVFALDPVSAEQDWSRWWKICLTSLLTLLLMRDHKRLHLLVIVIAGSLAFYGVKGGFFTLVTGGGLRVWGPPGTFLEDNNSMGLALILTVPLLRYLQLQAQRRWAKLALAACIGLTVVAILGTQSRGALLGVVAMGSFLIWKSPGRWRLALAAIVLVPVLWMFMPSSWHARMDTIGSYEQDGSALGRINAWWFAFNLAKDHPLTGGGFSTFTPELFEQYAPDPDDFHDAHSIYFEVLAEQGFVGFGLFMLLGWLVFASCRRVASLTRDRPDLDWARTLCSMVQVSLVGYAVAGAFLGLAYFDLVYHLVALVVLTRALVEDELAQPREVTASPPIVPSLRRASPQASRAVSS
jgi:probable O-glycosylation ligase (exosortase A-associated)